MSRPLVGETNDVLTAYEREHLSEPYHELAAMLRKTLAAGRFPPGITVRVEFGEGTTAWLVASTITPDATDTTLQTNVYVQQQVRFCLARYCGPRPQLGDFTRQVLIKLFTDEVDEWLVLGDEVVTPTHLSQGWIDKVSYGK